MKKLMFAAIAASTLLSTPALAADWQDLTYGQDAWGIYQVNANVASFCKFGTANTGGTGLNGSSDTSYLGGANEADGRFNLDIQDPNDDTVRDANAQYDIGYAVCNSPFDMQLSSQNGGLQSDQTTSDNAFIENVPYQVKFAFDGQHANERSDNLSSSFTTITSVPEARAGAAHVQVLVNARDKLLLEGAYTDVLQARLSPTI